MKRGELWTVSGGIYSAKPRPALVLQDDRFDATDSITVVPLTTYRVDAPLLRVAILADSRTGLSTDSWAMIDKITTVRKAHLGSRVGTVRRSELTEVARAAAVFLGLAG